MITVEQLLAINKNDLQEEAKELGKEELPQLVEWLKEKDDKIRYQALLLLQSRSRCSNDVYSYWDNFQSKFKSDNSYQRSIGLIMIAENVRWDQKNKLDQTIDDYLMILQDEKPITVRQCIQALSQIVVMKPHLNHKIAEKLMAVNLIAIKETMRKLVLMDIITVLAVIRKNHSNSEVENYIMNALTGDILDKKAKKQVEALL